MSVTHMQQVCKQCPFSRTIEPGALGGSSPETYLGQAAGPFVLPCHLHCDFDDPDWKAKTVDTPQCAGAAIYRANIGMAQYLPPQIHRLAPNVDAVFARSVEFLAHHKKVSLWVARKQLIDVPVSELLARQMRRADNIEFKL